MAIKLYGSTLGSMAFTLTVRGKISNQRNVLDGSLMSTVVKFRERISEEDIDDIWIRKSYDTAKKNE